MRLLCDIGNTRVHFFDGRRVWHVAHDELERYRDAAVDYICVSPKAKKVVERFERWRDLEPCLELETGYEGLGADRKALCMAIDDGVVVDAGSAVTVDVVRGGRHQGGFIYPGLAAMRRAYASISGVLDHPIQKPPSRLPQKTAEAISYGALRPLALAISELGGPVVVTGGDGELLASLIPGARYDEALIFKGLQRIKDRRC